ncbi:MAG: YggS family pyridoxal phosphate-dependent enzyme [Acutalibacteraceae bacterium]|nr:YggS family pyridoxal phosphate-dependent enzyme [Acutalibacteraceae bacterium]
MITNSFDEAHFPVIAENIKRIKNEIAEAAIKSNRSSDDVRLMAVTKTVCVEYINYALDNCGIDLIGENKVQEFLSKKESLHLENVKKHLIGHLQTNKVKKIVGEVDMIQSVDSFRVAQAVSNEANKAGITADVLLEINIGDEDSKTGFDKIEFEESLNQISLLPNINVKGLMTIPPICDNSLELEKYFDKMNSYYNEIKEGKYANFNFEILSMGMSGDYKEAILHGSNLVRVGSAIFGARIYK